MTIDPKDLAKAVADELASRGIPSCPNGIDGDTASAIREMAMAYRAGQKKALVWILKLVLLGAAFAMFSFFGIGDKLKSLLGVIPK